HWFSLGVSQRMTSDRLASSASPAVAATDRHGTIGAVRVPRKGAKELAASLDSPCFGGPRGVRVPCAWRRHPKSHRPLRGPPTLMNISQLRRGMFMASAAIRTWGTFPTCRQIGHVGNVPHVLLGALRNAAPNLVGQARSEL